MILQKFSNQRKDPNPPTPFKKGEQFYLPFPREVGRGNQYFPRILLLMLVIIRKIPRGSAKIHDDK
ncbi:hypothetical protein UR09_00540 [Candidatus Nitromaritima sp. SCGC AAA799-A02]|nr:hypothetical protein UR09_00540 [Candidatus Nitromaritima sp. SCGC AAA799-A02]